MINTLSRHCIAVAVAAFLCVAPAWAFDFDDIDSIAKVEQGELLTKAEQAARAENFGEARRLLNAARNKAYDPKAVAAAESVYRQSHAAYEERKLREEQERLARIEAERQAREAAERQARADASGNAGGSLNCAAVSKNYGLWRYCSTGDCGGLSGNYGIYRLCSQNDPGGLSANFPVYYYLTTGDAGGFAKNYEAWSAAKRQAGSFADRKRFIIYYLNGYTYQ